MSGKSDTNELFKTSNLILLAGFTLFAAALTAEAFLLDWEKWPLILIGVAVVSCWIMHIRRTGNESLRVWICAALMMCTFFYYGTHTSSTFDLAIVIATVMTLFTMTGMKGLVTLAQISFYLTMTYAIVEMVIDGYEFDLLVISRTVLHVFMITLVGWFARTIIEKWADVLSRSNDEIDQLTESTDRLNDFLANVSHEIRTPVNAVIGLTGVCIDKEKDADVRKDMMSVRSAGRKVAEQIGDILDFSEIDRNKAVKNCEDYMLSSLMNDLVSELRENRNDDVELVINISPSIPAVMNTDVAKLKKIIRALVSNGLKYTKSGGVYLKIDSEPKDYGVNLCIEVTDTGIGMTDEQLENVYERFYQADSGRSRSGGGLGLGLGIVNGFVKLLGGFMTIKSRPGVGTTVRVSLPQTVVDDTSCMSLSEPEKLYLAAYLHFDKFTSPMVREYYNAVVFNMVKGLGVQMHRVENGENLSKLANSINITHLFVGEDEYLNDRDLIEDLAAEMVVVVVANPEFQLPKDSGARVMLKPFYCFPVAAILNAGLGRRSLTQGHMLLEGITALVVDDEPMNLIVAKSIFGRYHMNIDTAASGSESIKSCRSKKYDIIFMDHMMSGMDGVEAMKKIKADVTGLNRDVPIIALTANAMSSAKQMFINEGFDGFVSKPVEIEELERVLKKTLPKSAITYEDLSKKPAPAPAPEGTEETPAKEPQADDTPRPKTLRGKLTEAGIDVQTGLHYCAGDLDFYETLLLQVATEGKGKIGSLKGFYAQQDWKNYEILIHSTKSSMKTIGALALSEEALKLEMAAKGEDADYIIANHDRVIADYDRTITSILAALDKGDAPKEAPAMEGQKAEDEEEVFEFGPENGEELS